MISLKNCFQVYGLAKSSSVTGNIRSRTQILGNEKNAKSADDVTLEKFADSKMLVA